MEEKKVLEKYETPEVDFVEMDENDVIATSGLCTGGRGGIENDD